MAKHVRLTDARIAGILAEVDAEKRSLAHEVSEWRALARIPAVKKALESLASAKLCDSLQSLKKDIEREGAKVGPVVPRNAYGEELKLGFRVNLAA
jgi:hypothetical protein